MQWKYIDYSSHSGNYNMTFDLNLVKNCPQDRPTLRFYGWDPFCISIGANQSFNEIDPISTRRDGIDIVKRPTGGRAILHADELTYAVILPNSKSISSKELYFTISSAIIMGLKRYDNRLSQVELENNNPNFHEVLSQPSGGLCFASTAKSEIKYLGKKLVGSAQRKLGTKILQHGSILIGPFHKKLVNYLNVHTEEKMRLQDEISQKTIEIETIIKKEVDIKRLQKEIMFGFQTLFKAQFITEDLEAVS